jgi:hypothetical protein
MCILQKRYVISVYHECAFRLGGYDLALTTRTAPMVRVGDPGRLSKFLTSML